MAGINVIETYCVFLPTPKSDESVAGRMFDQSSQVGYGKYALDHQSGHDRIGVVIP